MTAAPFRPHPPRRGAWRQAACLLTPFGWQILIAAVGVTVSIVAGIVVAFA